MKPGHEAEAIAAAPDAPRIAKGLYLYGLARARSLRSAFRGTDPENVRIRYRDIDALVRAVPFSTPEADTPSIQRHQHVLEGAMRKGTVLPLPFGIVFRDRRELLRFLEDQYLVLDEGLSFLDGHFEMRLHVSARDAEPTPEHHGLAQQVYAELRRNARAALPMPSQPGRLLTAAFLVDRGAWVEFVERAEDLDVAHPGVEVDVTGPWPAYDFVRLSR
ncbi:MAG: GvpL/GvpF family gas vesicle protein [Longimicrobiales bacterium]